MLEAFTRQSQTNRIGAAIVAAGALLVLTASTGTGQAPPTPSVEGTAFETRPPEKKDNRPEFPEQTRAPYKRSDPFTVTTVIDGLPAPWAVAFLPSGNLLVTERIPGQIDLFDVAHKTLHPLSGTDAVVSGAAPRYGMLDVALDPAFPRTRRIFFSFFELVPTDRGITNGGTQIARAVLDEAGRRVTDVRVIFRAQPAVPSKRLGGKTGGRIVFDPQGNLLMPVGDRSDSPPWNVAQQMDTHLGKIIRVTPDGAVPADNPFVGQPGVLPEIWATGLRSQEGFAYDPATGRLWLTDMGPRGGDELNIIERGSNYGWPVVAHGIDYPGGPIGDGAVAKDGLESPRYYWDPSIAPSGLAFYAGELFPAWKGSLFVGALRTRMLLRLQVKNDRIVAEEPLLADRRERVRDVRVAPDGSVYVLTDSGGSAVTLETPRTSKLLRLTPR
ncbi:MAG: PQQ-dependent sugar dehydrogenase [Vicinamibacterales bacterium]